MTPRLRPYLDQVREWPANGRHILAQHDADSIVVYQAFRPAIASYAVEHQRFGGEFSFARMSWIKPNFLWMMFRSGWATRQGQERILAATIPRVFFDEILRRSVPSTCDASDPGMRAWWADWRLGDRANELTSATANSPAGHRSPHCAPS